MLFKRFYDDGLAQASYLIGCAATGEALVVDPNRAIDPYLAAAEAEGLRITHVTETHIHADFVSGSRELAARTGARMYLSDAGPAEWKYGFAQDPAVTPLRDGDTFMVGNIRLDVRHTPGHTPEHLSFVVTDTAGASEPMGVLTGDFVFVGDVGRPDLLEKAARMAEESAGAARALFHSLQAFKRLPDHLQIWPGHGAGSACGKGLSAVPQSTIGYERRFNWAFAVEDEAEFIRKVLAGQPEPPAYFGLMKIVNRDGPEVLGPRDAIPRVGPDRVEALVRPAVVVDMRPAGEFATGHIPGTISIAWNRSFVTYAGSLLPYDRDLYLLGLPDQVTAEAAARALRLIGLDRVRGWLGADAVSAWASTGRPLEEVPQLTVAQFGDVDRSAYTLVDVRGLSEWEEGHIEGAIHLPLPQLLLRMDEIPDGKPVVMQCAAGGRSAIAASMLLAHGRPNVVNLAGGFGAWRGAGLPEVGGEPVNREAVSGKR